VQDVWAYARPPFLQNRRRRAPDTLQETNMATKNGASALEFIREQLKKNPEVPFAEVKEAASKRGFTIYPIMYGRALSLEGLVKPGARRRNRAGGAQREGAAPRRGARAADAAAPAGMPGLDAVVVAMQRGERYRAALQEIQRILAGVL
jgi:hypothetical protein